MKAYVLATSDDLLLFESATTGPDKKRTIGAFVPGQDGNYYSELLIGFRKEDGEFTLGFQSWWNWMKSSIKAGDTLIDDDFDFGPEDVRIVSFEIVTNRKTQ